VAESELLGVQEVTAEIANARAELRILNRIVAAGAVSLVADDWMFEPRKVHANLVRAAGL
jgi:hypothetical protein